ncbi:MAG TPA: FAD-binding oxidoreductase [Candidatus Anoxymicrobiaceae bacterium]
MAVRPYDSTVEDTVGEVLELVKGVVGEDWVTDDPAITIGYSKDNSFETAKKPHIVALPENTEQVQEIVRIAGRYGMAVQPASAAINCAGGCIPQRGGILLDLRRMDKILEIDAENMTITMQPAVRFGVAQNVLRQQGLYAVNPSAPHTAGVATNHMDKGIGMPANKFGVGPDHIVSMTFVMPDGEILKTGSSALPGAEKVCVEGPGPDISGLFHSSMGIFGVMVEMITQVYEWPKVEVLKVAQFETEDLNEVSEFFYKVTREDFVNECSHLQDSYFSWFATEDDEVGAGVVEYIPRNNAIVIMGGENEEEARLKDEQFLRLVERNGYELMDDSVVDMLSDMIGDIAYECKVLQSTMRVTRFFGSFQVVWFNSNLDRVSDLHKKYQRLADKHFKDTDWRNWQVAYPPTEVTVYTQPLEFGRSVMLELDFFISFDDSESVKRGLAFGYDAINMVLDDGGHFDRPYGGSGSFNFGTLQTPRLGTYSELLGELKADIDPRNIMAPGRLNLPVDPA